MAEDLRVERKMENKAKRRRDDVPLLTDGAARGSGEGEDSSSEYVDSEADEAYVEKNKRRSTKEKRPRRQKTQGVATRVADGGAFASMIRKPERLAGRHLMGCDQDGEAGQGELGPKPSRPHALNTVASLIDRRQWTPLFAVRELLQNWYDAMISKAWDYVRARDPAILTRWPSGGPKFVPIIAEMAPSDVNSALGVANGTRAASSHSSQSSGSGNAATTTTSAAVSGEEETKKKKTTLASSVPRIEFLVNEDAVTGAHDIACMVNITGQPLREQLAKASALPVSERVLCLGHSSYQPDALGSYNERRFHFGGRAKDATLKGRWILTNYVAELKARDFAHGMTGKRQDKRVIGHFGTGLKKTLCAMLEHNLHVGIFAGRISWGFRYDVYKNRPEVGEQLIADEKRQADDKVFGTTVRAWGLQRSHFDLSRFLFLCPPPSAVRSSFFAPLFFPCTLMLRSRMPFGVCAPRLV